MLTDKIPGLKRRTGFSVKIPVLLPVWSLDNLLISLSIHFLNGKKG